MDQRVHAALLSVSRYPEARGRPVFFRLDCYDVPRQPVQAFFLRFADSIRVRSDIHAEIQEKGFATSLDFEFHWASSL